MPEVIVVGAGIVGALTALELCERGWDVVVVEAATPASGASGGPGKRGVRANGRDPRELPLVRRAQELWAELSIRLEAAIGYERCGHLLLSETAGADLEALADRQRRAGIHTEVLGASALLELEPQVSQMVRAGAWCPSDGVADHTATTLATVAAVTRLGGRLRIGTTVTGVRIDRNDVSVTLDGERLHADACVLAANQALHALLRGVGLDLPIFPVFPQVLIVRPPRGSPARHLIGHAQRPLSLKTLPSGEVMVTGGRLGRFEPAIEEGVVVDREVTANLADAVATFPELADAELVSSVADRAESATPDLVPIVDTLPQSPTTLFATGWSGHGWAIAPAVAEALALWLTTGTRPVELVPFTANRFA